MKIKKTNVIEWRDRTDADIVWRYPYDDIRWGSYLVVKEGEVAVFMRDGRYYDVFGPGRYLLSTQNLPLLTRAFRLLGGYGETPFKATVIFVSTKEFVANFGVKFNVPQDRATPAMVPLKVHGRYRFKVVDPTLFLNQVCAGLGSYSTDDVMSHIAGMFEQEFISAASSLTFVEIYQNLRRASAEVMASLNQAFAQRGMRITDVRIEGVDTDEQFRDRIYFMQALRSAPGAADQVMRVEALKDVARSLGKSPGAAVGAGWAAIQPLVYPPPQQAGGIRCPNCGHLAPPGSKFCPNCGSPLTGSPSGSVACPNCGALVSASAKFCPYCGYRLK